MMTDCVEKASSLLNVLLNGHPKPLEGAAGDINSDKDISIVQKQRQSFHQTNLTMKPIDYTCHKGLLMGDKNFPNMRKWNKFEHGLKRTKRIYLHGSNNDIISKPMLPPKENPIELPGIGAKQKRKKRGTICVHDNKALCASSRSQTIIESGTTSSSSNGLNSSSETRVRPVEDESHFGGNSSSATGSESWTSGNGSTSPRRRIRVPTSLTLENGEQSKYTSQHRSPRPPSKPKNVPQKPLSKTTDRVLVQNESFTIRHDKGDESDDDQRTPFRPKTPVPGKSRQFKATLQNIEEFCPPPDSNESDGYKEMKLKRVSNALSRRRSVGTLLNNQADGNNDAAVQTRYGRRKSMPIDLHELKEQIDGIRFINVREFSRAYIQDILSRRDKEATKGIAGDKRRQNKCLSWLQSLEGAL